MKNSTSVVRRPVDELTTALLHNIIPGEDAAAAAAAAVERSDEKP